MIAFHLTRYANLKSIQKYGILPTLPQNLDHRDIFNEYGWSNDEDKIIYLWGDDGNLDKYIKDLIYAKYFIHPRIDYWQNNGENHCYDFTEKYTDKLFGLENDKFTLLKIEHSFFYEIEHWQENDDDELNTNYYMDLNYTHKCKPLLMHPFSINNFDILQNYNVSLKNKKLNIS